MRVGAAVFIGGAFAERRKGSAIGWVPVIGVAGFFPWRLLLFMKIRYCGLAAMVLALVTPLESKGRALSVFEYIESCRKENGAFGPVDQDYTDAAWNYPAVSALQLLGKKIDSPDAIFKYGMGYPKGHVGYGHWQFFHQHKIRQLLGQPIRPKHIGIGVTHQGFDVRYYGSPFGVDDNTFFRSGGESGQHARDVNATELGFYNLSSLFYLLMGMQASGREPLNPAELADYVLVRQAPNGGFTDVRVEGSPPVDSETHVVHTYHSVAILRLLGVEPPNVKQCGEFIRACQSRKGGFYWNPDTSLIGNEQDVYYTWAALHALKLMGRDMGSVSECSNWLNSLHNLDGGFGDRPGWRSRLYSTYYAVDSLKLLGAGIREPAGRESRTTMIPEGRYRIFQALFKTPEIEAEDLAALNDRGFNLLGLKSYDFDLVERLRMVIADQKLPMDVILSPEAYPHRTRLYGGLILHHICNLTLDPNWRGEQRSIWEKANVLGAEGLVWPDYLNRVMNPLQELGSIIYPEQDFEMELAYLSYDSREESGSGYNAMLAGFNWSPSDFIRVFPWRERYVDKLPVIADVDAHGDLLKWSSQLDFTRNLFLANGPTYADFQEAAAAGRVVCVIPGRDGETTAYYGPVEAVQTVIRHLEEWKWW